MGRSCAQSYPQILWIKAAVLRAPRPGARCDHNLNYWNFGDYLGVGAGAHGKLTEPLSGKITRTVREREPRRYLARGFALAPATVPVRSEDLPFEFMMNALRLVDGFEPALFEARTGLPWDTVAGRIERLAARGLLECPGDGAGYCRATELGQRFLNDAIAEFLPMQSVV